MNGQNDSFKKSTSKENAADIYGEKVLSLASSIVNDPELAFETACEVFTTLYRSQEEYFDDRHFEKQLFLTCRTTSCQLCKRSAKVTGNPLQNALLGLPAKYRSILILNDVYRLTAEEIGLLWDISGHKVLRRLEYARMLIGNILKKQISE